MSSQNLSEAPVRVGDEAGREGYERVLRSPSFEGGPSGELAKARTRPRLGAVATGRRGERRLGAVSVSPAADMEARSRPSTLVVGAEPVPGYKLAGRIDSGGTNEVWKAVGPGGFAVALTFLGGEPTAVPKPRPTSRQSLKLVRTVRHPNLETVFGTWRSGGRLVVGTELADESLLDLHRRAADGGLPGLAALELLDLLEQAARGVDHLNAPRQHASGREGPGLQHRNLKPGNLLILGDCVKISALHRVAPADEPIDSSALDPVYTAPEQFRGRASRWSDQYSLAATYCHLRGGRPPFAGDPWMVILGHCFDEPDLTMLPEPERPAVARALAKRPEERWPDCASFVSALRDAHRVAPKPLDVPPEMSQAVPHRAYVPGPIAPDSRSLLLKVGCILALIGAGLAAYYSERTATLRGGLAPGASPVEAVGKPRPPRVVLPASPSPPVAEARRPAITPPRPIASFAAAPRSGPTLDRFPERAFTPPPKPGWDAALVPLIPGPRIPDSLPPDEPTVSPLSPSELLAAEGERERRRAEEQELNRMLTRKRILEALDRHERHLAEAVRRRSVTAGPTLPATATIDVLMPAERSELVVRGDVGKGNPDEWYGPKRVIHTPPLSEKRDYVVGAFWKDATGSQASRSCRLSIEPGKSYEVDLRGAEPSWKQVRN